MSGADADGRKVFVGGIPFGVEQNDIRQDFGKFGDIEDVYLPTDRETGKLRGFGFITFGSARDAEEASQEMNGCVHALGRETKAGKPRRCHLTPTACVSHPCRRDYRGRDITVNIARPREAGGGGGGGFRGGGDRGGRGGNYDRGPPQDR